MKNIILAIIVLMAVSVSACSLSGGKKGSNTTLVAYFSASGTTREAATELSQVAHADLFEIVPEHEYTDADLDWEDHNSRSSVEMENKKSRPSIKNGKIEIIEQYDTIYIGFPIWWYTAPTIINTFIEQNNLRGKVLITFATSGGSTVEKATRDLRSTYPELKWKEGSCSTAEVRTKPRN